MRGVQKVLSHTQILDYHTPHNLCKSLTCTEIKSENLISFSCFIRNGKKCSVMVLVCFEWSLELFERLVCVCNLPDESVNTGNMCRRKINNFENRSTWPIHFEIFTFSLIGPRKIIYIYIYQ